MKITAAGGSPWNQKENKPSRRREIKKRFDWKKLALPLIKKKTNKNKTIEFSGTAQPSHRKTNKKNRYPKSKKKEKCRRCRRCERISKGESRRPIGFCFVLFFVFFCGRTHLGTRWRVDREPSESVRRRSDGRVPAVALAASSPPPAPAPGQKKLGKTR